MKPKKAIKELRRQLERDPHNLVLRLRLAGLLCEIGDRAEGVRLYSSVALAYQGQGRLSQAIAVCKSLLEIDPQHVDTQRMLAQLELRRLERESEEARSQPRPALADPAPRSRRGRRSSAPPRGGRGRTPSGAPPTSGSGSGSGVGGSRITPRGKSDSLPPLFTEDRSDPGSGVGTGSGSFRRSPSGGRVMPLQPRRPEVEHTVVGAVPAPMPRRPERRGSAPSAGDEDSVTNVVDEPVAGESDEIETGVAVDLRRSSVEDDDAPTRVADEAGGGALPVRRPGRAFEVPGARRMPAAPDDDDADEPTVIDDGLGRLLRADVEADPDGVAATIDLGEAAGAVRRRSAPGGERRETRGLRVPPAPIVDGALLEPFADVAPSAVEELARRAISRRVAAGEMILSEGDAGDSCFVIAAGEVRVLKRSPLDPEGGLLEVAQLGEGQIFGEFGLLGDRRRHASVQAIKSCTLYEIQRAVLLNLGGAYPALQNRLDGFYRRRMLETLMATAPFFGGLSLDKRRELVRQFSPVRAHPGQRLIREGERSGGFYLVVLGSVEITKRLGADRTLPVAVLDEGAYFGEMSLLRGDVAQASVTAIGHAELALLAPRRFYALVAANPVLWSQVREEASRREGETHRIVAGVTASV